MNTDSSNSSVYFGSDGSTSEQGEKHHLFDSWQISVADLEAEYNS